MCSAGKSLHKLAIFCVGFLGDIVDKSVLSFFVRFLRNEGKKLCDVKSSLLEREEKLRNEKTDSDAANVVANILVLLHRATRCLEEQMKDAIGEQMEKNILVLLDLFVACMEISFCPDYVYPCIS